MKLNLNKRRRNIIKLTLLGSGAFVLGKILGPSIDLFSGSSLLGRGETNFKNFRVIDNDRELGVYDKLGNEILIIEKE